MQGKSSNDRFVGPKNWDGDGQQADEVFLIIDGKALFANGFKRGAECVGFRNGVAVQGHEADRLQVLLQLAGRSMRQQQLADRRAIGGHPAACLQLDPQRPVAFDAIDVDHLVAIEDADVAGRTHLRHKPFQDLVNPLVAGHRRQPIDGETPEARAETISLLAEVALHELQLFKLGQQPVHRLAVEAGDQCEVDGTRRVPCVGKSFEDCTDFPMALDLVVSSRTVGPSWLSDACERVANLESGSSHPSTAVALVYAKSRPYATWISAISLADFPCKLERADRSVLVVGTSWATTTAGVKS